MKLRATQLDALLRNWETYEKMLGEYEAGIDSMSKEAEKTADSLEGRLNALSNTWTKTVENIANSEGLKAGVSALNALLTVINKVTKAAGTLGTIGLGALGYGVYKSFGNIPMLSGAIEKLKKTPIGYVGSNGTFDNKTVDAYVASLRGLSKTQAEVALSSAGLDKVQKQQILNKYAETSATVTLTSAQASEALARSLGTKEAADELLIKSGLITEEQLLAGTTIEVTSAKLADAVATGALTQKEANQIATAFGLTGSNIALGESFKLLTAQIWGAIKAMAKWLLTNPVGWCVLAIGAVAGLVTAFDGFIGRREKLAREKIKVLDEDIAKFDEEIATLEELHAKFEEARGDRSKLAQIQRELNDAIGETKGLLNGESKAYDIANAKLQANIELKKSQRKALQDQRIEESKVLYNANVVEIDWAFDMSGANARKYAEAAALVEQYGLGSLTQKQKDNYGNGFMTARLHSKEFAQWQEDQAETALDVFEDTISSYDGTGGKELIRGLVSDMARDGAELSKISSAIEEITNSKDMQDAINTYWESFVNPNIDSEDALQAVRKIFDDIIKKFPTLKDFLNKFYDGIVEGGGAAKKATVNIEKTKASISDLESASDKIKNIGTAFKELSEDGFITTKTLGEIQTATGLSGDEWEEYQTKLMRAKIGSSEFNQIMSDLTSLILDQTFAGKDLDALTEQEIASTLRENGVINANAVAREWLIKAKTREKIASMELLKGAELDIDSLMSEASACGIAKNAYLELVAKEILFNRNDLDVEDKIKKLNQIAAAAGVAGINMENLNNKFGSPEERDAYLEDNGVTITHTSSATYAPLRGAIKPYSPTFTPLEIGKDYSYTPPPETAPTFSTIQTTQATKYEFQDGTVVTDGNEAYMIVETNKLVERISDAATDIVVPNYSGNIKKSGSDDKPDYKDPNEAIINRINLRANELEQQGEYIQNALEIAEIEKDYEKQISLTNDLIANRKKRVEELNKANAGLHNEAEWLRNNNPWDEESWFDSQGNATETYYKLYNNSSKEEQEKIENLFDVLSEYKSAYKENSEKILTLNKEILQDEENIWDIRREIFDERMELSDTYIQNSIDFGWENGDTEIKARKRVLDWVESDYYRSLIKDDKEYYEILNENRLKYNEALENEFNKGTDFGNTYLDSRKTLLQSHYDVINSIAEAQHEINKELETSKTMYEYLDEDTRKLLFNQEDYNKLCKELNTIENKALKLQQDYEEALAGSTLETIESITSEYQMQYETLMKSYEIAKADLEIAKKKAKLNNVLNERNVRMFINGSWQWVANTEDVANAKSELADAQYAKQVEQAGLTQKQSIDNLTKQQDELGVVINKFENGVIDLGEAIYLAEQAIGSMPGALVSILNNTKSGTSYSSYISGSSYYRNSIATMQSNSAAWRITSSQAERDRLSSENQKIGASLGLSYDSGSGTWKKPDGTNAYATGTRYTDGGLASLGEDGFEAFISSNGRLIPINQPTIGNIASGGIVFNTDQMKSLRTLWDMSNLNLGGSGFAGNTQSQQASQVYDNRIIINGMTVDSGSSDGQALISALRRYVGNH